MQITKKAIIYLDENKFNKQMKSLRLYFMGQYKYLTFDFFKNGILKKENGMHIEYLKADKTFEKVYGKLELHYEVQDKAIILYKLEPEKFLKEGHKRILNTYKGVPYYQEIDKKKIELILRLEDGRRK